jgi:crotonobetainyl-CoA:carnitine CoA-transferase CaiB-like acyl-CoA transferase
VGASLYWAGLNKSKRSLTLALDKPGGRKIAKALDRTGLDAGPAPLLGEHTDAVLAEVLDLSAAEIGRLHGARIVAGPDGR